MQLINWGLVKHPLNWFTIALMLFLAAMAGTLALELLGVTPALAPSGDAQTGAGTGSGGTGSGITISGNPSMGGGQ